MLWKGVLALCFLTFWLSIWDKLLKQKSQGNSGSDYHPNAFKCPVGFESNEQFPEIKLYRPQRCRDGAVYHLICSEMGLRHLFLLQPHAFIARALSDGISSLFLLPSLSFEVFFPCAKIVQWSLVCGLEMFGTCFIFHNIWDNPSHWLSHFSEG